MEFRLVKYFDDNTAESYPMSQLEHGIDFDTVGFYERDKHGLQMMVKEITPSEFERIAQQFCLNKLINNG